MKKKLLALVCALALTLSLAGCLISTPDTVGKIGDFSVSSGLYLLAQYSAYQQAAQLADKDQDTTNAKAFLKATITTDADTGDTALVKDYVAAKTLENLESFAAIDTRFQQLGGQLTDDQLQLADSYAQQLMDQYGSTYTANGIGLETLKAFEQLQLKHSLLLTLVYGPKGETPVADDELTQHLDSQMYELTNAFTPEGAADAVRGLVFGEAAAVQYNGYSLILMMRVDPLEVSTLDSLRTQILSDMKGEELEQALADYGAQLDHQLDTAAMNKLPAAKIEAQAASANS